MASLSQNQRDLVTVSSWNGHRNSGQCSSLTKSSYHTKHRNSRSYVHRSPPLMRKQHLDLKKHQLKYRPCAHQYWDDTRKFITSPHRYIHIHIYIIRHTLTNINNIHVCKSNKAVSYIFNIRTEVSRRCVQHGN